MPIKYSSKDKLVSGVPLGGLGTGTLQVFPDGTRGVFTGLNNWEEPLGCLHWFRKGAASDYRVSNPFSIYIERKGKKVSKLLQTFALDKCPAVKNIEMIAKFPTAELIFKDKDFPVDARLFAFSPFIWKEYKDSGLPAAIYNFKVHNPTKETITVSIMGSAVNVNGSWVVGRLNEVVLNEKLVGLEFHKRNPHPQDLRFGSVSLVTDGSVGKVTYMGEWSYAGHGFRGKAKDRRIDAWPYFSYNGTLPNTNAKKVAEGEKDEWMGALAVKFKLKPKQTKEVPFYYTWHMPRHYLGHAYEKWFRNSWSVAEYVHKNKDRLLKETLRWHKTIDNSSLSGWLKDALINNLYVYTSASWWTKKGDFTLYENTVKYPLMDSLDVRYYGTVPLAILFPELEKSTMRLFAKYQKKDGYIFHDLGRSQIGCPSAGTSAGHLWKDLCTKFALMAYRDYLWTEDNRFLKQMYPHVKRAMEWEFRTDKNKDYLPDNEGADATYDLWEFHGTSSYTASIFLASLLASEKMAEILKDRKFANKCRNYFEKGRKSFDEQLWNYGYYKAAHIDKDGTYDASVVGQLNGQWYAHLLGLGYILPEDRVKEAVKNILRLNCKASKFGAVNSVFPDGKVDRSSYHSENIWAGESYAFASLAIYEGFVKEGLELSKRIWDHFVKGVYNPWSQPDVIFAKDGKLGDGELYLRNLSIWTIPFALAKHDKKIKKFLLKIEPRLKF